MATLQDCLRELPAAMRMIDLPAPGAHDLHVFANRLGLYDAADTIKAMLGR